MAKFKVKDLIKELKTYNEDADVNIIAFFNNFDFSIVYDGSDGSTKESCSHISFYADELNAADHRILDEHEAYNE